MKKRKVKKQVALSTLVLRMEKKLVWTQAELNIALRQKAIMPQELMSRVEHLHHIEMDAYTQLRWIQVLETQLSILKSR